MYLVYIKMVRRKPLGQMPWFFFPRVKLPDFRSVPYDHEFLFTMFLRCE